MCIIVVFNRPAVQEVVQAADQDPVTLGHVRELAQDRPNVTIAAHQGPS